MLLTLVETSEKTCSPKQEYYLRRAAQIALKSNVQSHRHASIIVNEKTGEIISEGYNYHTTHMEHAYTIHSEVSALLKLKKTKHSIENCAIYVVRVGTDRMQCPLKYSAPCSNCTKAILKAGIKKVYYSTDFEFENYIKIHGPPNGYVKQEYKTQITKL